MHRKLFIGIIMVLVLLSPAAALAGGDIYVGGPYGTKITSLPYVISAPGAYYLGGNLSYSGNDHGITVNADNVTLDLMGFTLAYTGTDPPWSGIYGIHMDNRKNVEVRNGTLLGWDAGVWETAGGVGHRIINIRAVDVNAGVMLYGNGHLIQGCTASRASHEPGSSGFTINWGSGIISGCLVKNFAYGIIAQAQTVTSDNVIIGNGASETFGIYSNGGLVMGNQVSNCGNMGIEVVALSSLYGNRYPASLIGNTVSTSSSSQTGIAVTNPDSPTLMDQNTVTGPGTHYNWGASPVQWRNNAGYP